MNTAIRSVLKALFVCLLTACTSGGGACGGEGVSSELIAGPPVGESGNNSDNPFRALAVDPTDPNVIYVGSEGNGLFRSTDGGTNWSWLRTGLLHCGTAYPEIYSIAIDASDVSRLWLAANAGPGPVDAGHSATAGVYKSTDSGTSWTQVISGLPTSNANSVHVVSGSRVLVGLGAGTSTNGDNTYYPGGIYSTSPTRGVWTEMLSPVNTTDSVFWQIIQRGTNLFTFGGLAITDATNAVGVVKSIDNGANWFLVPSPLANLHGAHIEASSDGLTLYAGLRSDAAAPYFYKSVDGGSHWTNPAAIASLGSGPIRIVGNDPTIALAAGQEFLYRTTNGFSSVATVLTAAGTIMMIETAPSNTNIVYVTTKGLNVYRSTDAGMNFSLQSNIRAFIDSQRSQAF